MEVAPSVVDTLGERERLYLKHIPTRLVTTMCFQAV
jgi:hypothetical protein